MGAKAEREPRGVRSVELIVMIRSSIITHCKLPKCSCRGERRGERNEAACKITTSLDTETKKLSVRDKWII